MTSEPDIAWKCGASLLLCEDCLHFLQPANMNPPMINATSSVSTTRITGSDQSVMEEQRVQTCNVYRTDPNLPHRFNNPDCFRGYNEKKVHPLYRTSNQAYGSKKPTVHEMPTQFHGISGQASEAMLHSRMYRDHGFNTSVERSRVPVSMTMYSNRLNLLRYYHHGNKSCDGKNKQNNS